MRLALSLLTIALLAGATLPGCAVVAGGAVATGALMADDRRTAGAYVMDEEIELKAAALLRELRVEGVHANVTSFNRRLLLTGEVPTEAVKAKVADQVRAVENVREIANELALSPPTSLASRTGDGYITAKIKTRFLDDKRFSANHIKVVTENGVAYLMGLVERSEGAAAADIAAKTSGVRRVVKVFEYID